MRMRSDIDRILCPTPGVVQGDARLVIEELAWDDVDSQPPF
jgi:hypothetical protein